MAAVSSSFLTPFMGSAVTVALPAMAVDLTMDAVGMGWVPTAFLLAAAVFLLPFGKASDIYGRRRVFLWGIGVFTAASGMCALAPSSTFLIAMRVVHGLGSAMIFSTGLAILTSVYSPAHRGRVIGITVAAVYLGLSAGPFVGGILTEQFGWRSIFVAVVPLGLGVLAAIQWKVKAEWAEARGESLDKAGCAIYGLSLVALMYGLSILPHAAGALWMGVGLAGGAGFVYWETRAAHPLLDLELFRANRVFALSNLAALTHYGATFAVSFLLSLYLQYIKGFTPQEAGFILVSQPLVQAFFSPFAGRLSDQVEPRIVASSGMGLTAAGLFLLTSLGPETSLGFVVACLLLLGVGFALFSSPNSNAIMGSVDRRLYGVASAALGTMRLMGNLLSMGVAMFLFALFMGKVQIRPEAYGLFLTSARTAFWVFGLFCVGGVLASASRGRLR
jgi:EmrB/QacA subfamily drug resistance transporter